MSTTLLDTHEDCRAYEDLRRIVQGGRALALVGAGISASRRGWSDLLEEMAKRVEARTPKGDRAQPLPAPPPMQEGDEKLWRAAQLRDAMRDEYLPFLKSEFGGRSGSHPALKYLVDLPLQAIMTTNYDSSIHRACSKKGPTKRVAWCDDDDVQRFMFELAAGGNQRFVVHLHGVASRPGTIVLTHYDYIRQYVASNSTTRRLFALFAMRRVLFVGFSLKDPDLMAVLREVSGTLGKGGPRHFAVMGIDDGAYREDDRKRLQQVYGIDTVFYRKEPGDRKESAERRHWRLVELLKGLAETSPAARSRGGGGERRPPARTAAPDRRRAEWPSDAERRNPHVPDDPRKGMFGGVAIRNGRALSASVRATRSPNWFSVSMVVRAQSGAPLEGEVRYYLHDTFKKPVYAVQARKGEAELTVVVYGAFTVGACCDGGATELELDLAGLLDAPKRFRES
jgi:hypothetical protein